MDLVVEIGPDGPIARWNDSAWPCAIGRGGLVADKREGDGGTPVGRWTMRRVLYRPDKVKAPRSALPVVALKPDDGWCDAPGDPAYNRPVTMPYPASCEALWREDDVYDVIVVLGHNDDPPVPGAGSAIFLHLARAGFTPTEGCVALTPDPLLQVVAAAGPDSAVTVRPPE